MVKRQSDGLVESETHTCTRCKAVLPASSFYRSKDHKSGLTNWCKDCFSLYRKQTIDAVRARQHQHYEDGGGREYHRQYYLAHQDEILARDSEWRKTRKDIKQKYDEKYRAEHREHRADLHSVYYKNHPEKFRASFHARRAREKNALGRFTDKDWQEILDAYGNKCLCCGQSDIPLTIDHIVPLSLGGTNTKDNLQPLCSSCNSKKNAQTIDYRNDRFLYARPDRGLNGEA